MKDADADVAVVSASQGPVRSLPARIERLLSDPELELGQDGSKTEVRLLDDLKNGLQDLIRDGCLLEPSAVQYPALTARYWAEEIRELSYDIDGFLDELVRATADRANGKLRGRIARFRERRSRSRWAAKEISRFLAHLKDAVQRYHKYNLRQHETKPPAAENIDESPAPVGGGGGGGLVGIESCLAKIEGWLWLADPGESRLRVVSILGFAGVGKTTLATELYRRSRSRLLARKIDCRAYVRSSRRPNVGQLLTSILLQVRQHRPPDASESCNLAGTIRAHLRNKTYFIVIDDLWVSSIWDIIRQALPDDNRFSRIIITTEVEVVANRCCSHNSEHVFKMEPLCHEVASKLFSSRFGDNQPSITQSSIVGSSKDLSIRKKIQSEIVSKCGGFPLLTIATASLLAKKLDKEQWHCIWSSLCYNLETNPNIEGMKQVLGLCYDNLPDHLKTCMLYFSLYPEDEIIQRDDLVKLWITEGFICVKDGKDLKAVASTYFDELLSRGMIQPARIKRNGSVQSCTVHYLILDLIQCKSIQENFVTTLHHSETNIRLADKVHRLSLHFGEAGDAKLPEKLRLSQTRSLFFFGHLKSLPATLEFRFLRLLILRIWGDQDSISFDLIMVSKLFGLKHFTLGCNVTLILQGQLEGLQYLDTLKIDSRVTEVPQGIVHLPRLLHLSLPGDTILPNEIWGPVSLETLGCYDLSRHSAENVLSLGNLSNLQDLRLTCSTPPCHDLEEKVGCLASSLSELSNLKSLTILPVAGSTSANIPCDSLSTVSSPPIHLEKLELSQHICIFSRLPRWIGELGKLSILKIAARELSQEDINILKELNYLAALSLYVRTTTHAEKIIFDDKGFYVLQDFKFMCPALCPAFVKGAIPNVRTLKLGFCAQTLQQCSPVDAGFENLACAVFSLKVGIAGADESGRKFVHSSLKDIFGKRRSHPIINVHLVDTNFCGGRRMGASDENYTIGETSSTESWITLPLDSKPLPLPSSYAVDLDLPNPGHKPKNKATKIMESEIVSISTGAMNSTLKKLETSTLHEYEEFKGLGEQGLILKCELQDMHVLLKKFSNTTDPNVKNIRNQMRELTYEIEDSIDNFVTNIIDKNCGVSLEEIVKPYDFINQIRKLKAQFNDAELQSTVHPKIELSSLNRSYVSREHWLSRMDDNSNGGHVGMDGQRDELVRKLICDAQDKLQWICIVGDTGIGKTMLAKQVYNEIKGRFSTSVFVSAPKNVYIYSNVDRMVQWLYTAILENLGRTNIEDINSDHLISEVKKLLHAKRFLLVIDGVSSDEILHYINIALPQNNPGSGIIITTGSGDVVELLGSYSSSFVHPMMPLTFKESLCLFGSIISGSVRSCPVGREKDVEEIVKACRGVPLAIRVIAGALSSKPEEMEHRKSMYAKMIGGIDQQNAGWIQEILGICYSDLSCDMKTCLLYLCSFPENHIVRIDRLIRRWVSEGFLTQISEETLWEAGERYFVELISRKLIEPVYDGQDVLPTGCTVSSSVYDFITSQSSEENFVKLDVPNETLFLHHGSDNQMKHLAWVQGILSAKVRSLTFVCDYFGTKAMPDLSGFRHLRVLDLGDTKGMEIKQPETIGGLCLLRYLGLGGANLTKLPEEIAALEHLSTLDLRRTRVTNVPEFRGRKMISLLGDQLIFVRGRGMDGIQKMEELSQVLVGPDGSPADYMAELVNNEMGRLRILGVRFSKSCDHNELDRNGVKHFLEEMSKSKLQSLLLDNYGVSLFDILAETWGNKRTPYLHKFELRIRGCFTLDPQKIASLIALTHLIIQVPKAEQVISALGELPQLVLLNLYADTSTRLILSSTDGFRYLKVFRYSCKCGGGMGLQFREGAMPQLQRLWLDFDAQETMSKYGSFDFGIQHLSRLVQLCATIDCQGISEASKVERAEADMRAQASRNPNNPVLELNRRGHNHLTPHQGMFFISEAARDSVIEIHSIDEWWRQVMYANSRNKLLLIHFTATWCRPSRVIAPFFSDLSNQFTDVVFLKVDVEDDEMEDIVEEYKVDALPAFLFMIGDRIKDRLVGAYPEELKRTLNKLHNHKSLRS